MLTKITIENFKAFGEETIINIAPITLLFGKNSSGKSSILHAVGLVDDFFRALVAQPTTTQDAAEKAPSMPDKFHMLHKNDKYPQTSATLSKISDRAWEGLEYTDLVHGHDGSKHIRIRLDFQDDQGYWGIEIQWLGIQNMTNTQPFLPTAIPDWPFELYLYKNEDPSPIMTISGDSKTRSKDIPDNVKKRVFAELNKFIHTPSHRPIWTNSKFGSATNRGQFLNIPPEIKEDLQNEDNLKKVNDRLSEIDDRYQIDSQARIRLKNCLTEQPWMNLTQVGSGFAQILPIIYRCAVKKDCNLFMQQPEEELHPGAQCALGDAFIKSAQDNHNFILIETHSEHLLLRLRKRINNAHIIHDLVNVYVIENNQATFHTIEPDGTFRIVGWPDGFFEERAFEMGLRK